MKEHPDINDTLCGEGQNAVRARHDKARKFEPKTNGKGRTEESSRANQQPNGSAGHEVSLIWQCSCDVDPRPVSWLWPGRLAHGKLTLLAGDPGIGKSQISIDIAARITTGAEWPDGGRANSGSVIIISAEELGRRHHQTTPRSRGGGPLARAYPKGSREGQRLTDNLQPAR